MLLKNIEISNFKSFGLQKIDFTDLNILVGANAAGKSNFISILRFLKSIYESDFNDAISENGKSFLKNLNSKKDDKLIINIQFEPNLITEIKRAETIFLYRLVNFEYNLILNYKLNEFEIIEEKIISTIIFQEVKISENIEDSEIIQDLSTEFKYGLINKKGKIEKFPKNEKDYKIKTKISDLFFEIENPYPEHLTKNFTKQNSILHIFNSFIPKSIFNYQIYNFDTKLFKNNILTLKGSKLFENGENLTGIIEKIINTKESKKRFINLVSYVLDFVENIEIVKLTSDKGFFELKEKHQEQPIPSYLLSDGTINITALIVALYFEKSKLAIFEEPDNGIHPAIMATLMKMFEEVSDKKQIIITTHNPEIVRYTHLENILLIARNNQGFSEIIKPSKNKSILELLENEDSTVKQTLLNIIIKNSEKIYNNNEIQKILNEILKPDNIFKLKPLFEKLTVSDLFVLDLFNILKDE